MSTIRKVVRSSVFSIGLTFPAAALIGLVWRFPVPFGGYTEGVEALVLAPQAAFFYLIFGGFIVVPAMSMTATIVAFRLATRRAPSAAVPTATAWRLLLATSAGAAVAFALFLAGLELVIGPW